MVITGESSASAVSPSISFLRCRGVRRASALLALVTLAGHQRAFRLGVSHLDLRRMCGLSIVRGDMVNGHMLGRPELAIVLSHSHSQTLPLRDNTGGRISIIHAGFASLFVARG